jgi:hypothetical protein
MEDIQAAGGQKEGKPGYPLQTPSAREQTVISKLGRSPEYRKQNNLKIHYIGYMKSGKEIEIKEKN